MPPQRHDWWVDQAARAADLPAKGLPPEVVDQILEDTDQWPMGRDEAEKLRLDLMLERTQAGLTVDDYFDTYNFCEH